MIIPRKQLLLIPLVILPYLIHMNFLPLGGTQTYLINVGANDLEGSARISGPIDRISEPKIIENCTCRELRGEFVYFIIDSNYIKNGCDVIVKFRFKNFLPYLNFYLGARNKKDWSYCWKKIPTSETAEWKIVSIAYNSSEIYVNDLTLSFCYYLPFVTKEEFNEKVIPIDWIEITISLPPIWNRPLRSNISRIEPNVVDYVVATSSMTLIIITTKLFTIEQEEAEVNKRFSNLKKELFTILLITFFLLHLLEKISPKSVSNYLDLNYLVITVIISGLLNIRE